MGAEKEERRLMRQGAWMRKARDDKAIRRVAVKEPEPVPVERYDPVETAGNKRGLLFDEEVVPAMGIQQESSEIASSDDDAYNEPSSNVDAAPAPGQVGVGEDQLEQENEDAEVQLEIEENLKRELGN